MINVSKSLVFAGFLDFYKWLLKEAKETGMRALIRFGKQPRLRFISHLDLQTSFSAPSIEPDCPSPGARASIPIR